MNLYYLLLISFAVFVFVLFLINRLLHISTRRVVIGGTGLVIGLVIATLVNLPISRLPEPFGGWLPLVISVFFGIGGIFLFVAWEKPISNFFSQFSDALDVIKKQIPKSSKKEAGGDIIVDTSVLIDGRIEDIAKTGFISGRLIVIRPVLEELQNIADSKDPLRRNRGRRGLEILNSLRKNKELNAEIVEDEALAIKEVDAKLVEVAKKRRGKVLTVDYNLNRVAEIQHIKVLNINELSNSLKAVVLPGEEIEVKIVQVGKEKDQGVGYLPDGTMIVVEGGDKHIGDTITCEVHRIFQTVAGKMIFVRPKGQGNNNRTGSNRGNFKR